MDNEVPAISTVRRTLRWLFGATASTPLASSPETWDPPPYFLGNTQVRTLPRSANGQDYQIYVSLPYSYYQKTDRHHPVVYLCDGYWHFSLLCGLYSGLVSDRVVPEFIGIGLGYAGENPNYDRLRQRDLSPARVSPLGPPGEAPEFLEVLRTEIIPFIDNEYRTDRTHRTIAGSSLGGLFGLYALLGSPQLFTGCIAISPSVGVGRDWLFRHEEGVARERMDLPARLFTACGGGEHSEYVAGIRRFDRQLSERGYRGLEQEFRLVDGERHSTTVPEALNRGLRFVFEPLAPATGWSR